MAQTGEIPRPEGIWIIDAAARTSYANDRMAEILGASPSELIGQPSFAYVYPEDADAAGRLFEAKMRGDTAPFPFRSRRQEGTAIWVSVQGTPMRNNAGEYTGIIGTFSVSP